MKKLISNLIITCLSLGITSFTSIASGDINDSANLTNKQFDKAISGHALIGKRAGRCEVYLELIEFNKLIKNEDNSLALKAFFESESKRLNKDVYKNLYACPSYQNINNDIINLSK